jgi:signal transduction histidine kinase
VCRDPWGSGRFGHRRRTPSSLAQKKNGLARLDKNFAATSWDRSARQNPLNSIRLSLQMLAQRQEGNRLHKADFQMVIDDVDRMNALLSDLLAFQQPRPPKMELRRVGPILENCVQFAKPQAGKQEVDVVLAGNLSQDTLLDEQYFRQIMLNLILNAIDASQGGEQVLVNATAANGSIAIEVSERAGSDHRTAGAPFRAVLHDQDNWPRPEPGGVPRIGAKYGRESFLAERAWPWRDLRSKPQVF